MSNFKLQQLAFSLSIELVICQISLSKTSTVWWTSTEKVFETEISSCIGIITISIKKWSLQEETQQVLEFSHCTAASRMATSRLWTALLYWWFLTDKALSLLMKSVNKEQAREEKKLLENGIIQVLLMGKTSLVWHSKSWGDGGG